MTACEKVNVLLVDDRPENLTALEAILGDLGENLIRASSGDEALRVLLREEVAAILLDVQMPGMDGFETAALIRARERSRNTPIIFITAIPKSEEQIRQGYAIGAVDYILKPFNPEILRWKVSVFVDLHRAAMENVRHIADIERLNRELASANEELRSFSYSVAHDLRALSRAGERRALNEAIFEYHKLFENVPVGLFRCGTEGRFLGVNRALLAMFASTDLETMKEKTLSEFFAYAADRAAWNAFLEGNKIMSNRTVFLRRCDGEAFRGDVSAQRVRDEHGQILFYEGSIVDVSEKTIMEQKFLRVQKLENIGLLAGGVAHDFNNLRAVIQENVSLLQLKVPADDPLSAYIESIEQASRRSAQLTGRLLAFSRDAHFNIQSVDLTAIVKDILKITEMIFDKSVVIRTEFADPVPPIDADPTHIHQALMNLCVNARDAMPHGGTLTIAAGTGALPAGISGGPKGRIHSGDYVALSVTDTGVGMDKKTLARIFDPFFTTKKPEKGTGLGLAVVYGVARKFHGLIDVRSEPGRGSTFTLYFPPGSQPKESALPETTDLPGGHETILLVDDEEMVRTMVERALTDFGYRVLTAIDGERATALFRERSGEINLVILDMNTPGMDGLAAMKEMRTVKPRIKVLLSSGYSKETRIEEAARIGIDGLLPKPYPIKVLLTRVRAALDAGNPAGGTE